MSLNIEELQKKYQNLHFKDDFMFGAVMRDTKIAKGVLKVILAKEIPDIENCEIQRIVENDWNSRGVRYDVYIKSVDGAKIYDIEMQTVNSDNLPKRSRYYQASSDMDFLRKGQNYRELPENYIIFICEFDLFGKDKAIYHFENYCIEEEVFLSDMTHKVFLNINGNTSRKELQNLMTYIKNNIPNDSLTENIEEKVQENQHSDKLFSSYIKEQQNIMEIEEEAKARGIVQGRAETITESIKSFIEMGMSKEQLIKAFHLSNQEAELYFNNIQPTS